MLTAFAALREHAWGGKKLNELIQPAFDGRYVLLLMACAAADGALLLLVAALPVTDM